ncbi:LytR C-terminal domain-containing protein [Streptomyces sp. NA04227]|uniref:LytR C-terminal domain-containing protein n=1 Tax=Streptomyces sp. NA04227 TaxID=2742136 RepID=UPI001590E055|nr:LytR C-terminal domain-containing protein [Streptomyces sp. NA04227]QKW06435.1 LytR C-terminal domain-containing protein [Streptomyces sp. NA04227]
MNDGYDGYDGQADDRYELVGYDESGGPVYRRLPPSPPAQGHSPQPPYQQQPPQHYGQQQQYGQQQYGQQQPYGAQPPHQEPQSYAGDQPYGRQPYGSGQQSYDQRSYDQQSYDQSAQGYGYDPYAQSTGTQPTVPAHDPYGHDTGTQAAVPAHDPYAELADTGRQEPVDPAGPGVRADEREPKVPGQSRRGPEEGAGEYRTEQFAFVEDPDEESEDVIDWLKFTESRTERREEAKRRGRNRRVALICVLVLALLGGSGYLWYAGKIPGLSADKDSEETAAAGPQNRDMIVVHLHNTKKRGTSTALLVNNTTTGRGSTVLLPNSLSVSGEDGSATTLAKSVDEDGSSGTSEAVDSLLGTRIEGTWRLDTPYLNNLVELVGDIEVDTDVDVPAEKAKKGDDPLVHKGEAQTLSGPMAVAYATYSAPGEKETAQLTRFGQVMQAVLRKLSSDTQGATVTVQSLAQILDPSLPERELGAFLAKLAERAKSGDYRTQLLPVERDGTLSRQTTDSVVKQVLGGKVSAPEKGEALRVGVRGGDEDSDGDGRGDIDSARVSLVNGGYTFVGGGRGPDAGSTSQVLYANEAHKQEAAEVAKTLGLPGRSVRKGEVPANADVLVVLGGDYTPPKSD